MSSKPHSARAISLVLLALTLAACGSSPRQLAVNATASGHEPGGATVTSSESWKSQGDSIRADKQANAKRDGDVAENAADYAYLSEPIDLAGPGKYTLEFRNVADWFDPPVSPTALGLMSPPDFRGTLGVVGEPVVSRTEAGRIMRLTVQVSDDVTYKGFSVWVY